MRAAAGSGARSIAVDLAATLDVDAGGIGVLVLLQRHARELGISMRLKGVSDSLRSLLSLTRLDRLFAAVDPAR